jgi:hypothetical protein
VGREGFASIKPVVWQEHRRQPFMKEHGGTKDTEGLYMNEEVNSSVNEQKTRVTLGRQPLEGNRTSLVDRFRAHEV